MCQERLSIFHAIRHCRRRPPFDWTLATIGRLFTTEDEFKVLHLRAVLSRARVMLRRRRVSPVRFVALCDGDGDGVISFGELNSALR